MVVSLVAQEMADKSVQKANFIEQTKFLIRTLCNIHVQGKKPNILLFATPRGGSTWLMEIIASQKGMKFYDEPFNFRRSDVARTRIINSWQEFMPEHAEQENVIHFLQGLSENRHGFMNPRPFRPYHRFFTDRIVFKIHELEFMAERIREALGAEIVYLLRHPIPTTLSRSVYPRLDSFMSSNYYRSKYLSSASRWQKVRDVYEKGSNLDKGVLSWCFENIDALKLGTMPHWTFITYEEILLNPVASCNHLANVLCLDNRDLLLEAVDQPSTNIRMSNQETQQILKEQNDVERRKNLVTKWRHKVKSSEEDSAMSIMEVFDLDIYIKDRPIATRSHLLFDDTPEMA